MSITRNNHAKPPFAIRLGVVALVIALSHDGQAEVTCGSHGCKFPNDVCCDTYYEVYVLNPVLGEPVEHTAVLLDVTKSNCGNPPVCPAYNGTAGFKYTESESMSHSCSGSDTAGIGLSVGEKGVAALDLSYATTAANGWQKVDTYSTEINSSWSYSVPPGQIQRDKEIGIWKDGTWNGDSHWNGIAQNHAHNTWYVVLFGNTTSSASGAKKYYSISGSVTVTNCSAGSCGG